ncbi:MAG TPA: patatin-like phospholipase family protein [Candidatus Methylomirabilis sp.]|nr:patatin-like phospholipase family protein [Candidatus Methylomirabilis sp.]
MMPRRAAPLSLLLLLVGCAHYPLNAPLATYDPSAGYRFESLAPGDGNTDAVLLCLAFSGGGTRAAALAYGVLQELRDTIVSAHGPSRSLLAESDCISSISGGSFTSSYYALFREQIFRNFEPRFLRRNIQGELAGRALNPGNWFRLMSPTFSRIDLAGELYDETVFAEKRYRDLIGGTRPFIILNATNMALGSRFEFTQDQFDFLGSDLGEYPIARAVAASSAFPVLLNPISLKNHPAPTGFQTPTAIKNALEDAGTNPRRYLWAKNFALYQDKAERPFLHLLDGGLADNIGLRAVTDAYTRGFIRRRLNDGTIKMLAVIVVNARTEPAQSIDRQEAPPGVFDVVMKTMTASMENYSFETIEFMRSLAGDRAQAQRDLAACQRILDARCPGGERLPTFPAEVGLHVIEINFEQLSDPREREFFLNLPTSFVLRDHQVDCLIAAGRKLLRASSEYRELLRELGGRLQPGAESAADFPPGGCWSN